jgi:hypothetical protein
MSGQPMAPDGGIAPAINRPVVGRGWHGLGSTVSDDLGRSPLGAEDRAIPTPTPLLEVAEVRKNTT